jgi:hypothetical protein
MTSEMSAAQNILIDRSNTVLPASGSKGLNSSIREEKPAARMIAASRLSSVSAGTGWIAKFIVILCPNLLSPLQTLHHNRRATRRIARRAAVQNTRAKMYHIVAVAIHSIHVNYL